MRNKTDSLPAAAIEKEMRVIPKRRQQFAKARQTKVIVKRQRSESPKEKLCLRRAMRADAPALLKLIIALARFENLPLPNAREKKRLRDDGFGKRPRFEAWLGFWEGIANPVGYAVLFETYSTFRASPTLYLEDVFVLEKYRGRGIGRALLRHCIRLAYERGCARMEWTCLDWNKKAQKVYEQIGAKHLSEWFLYRLDREGMKKIVATPGART